MATCPSTPPLVSHQFRKFTGWTPGANGDDIEVVFRPDEELSERSSFQLHLHNRTASRCALRGIQRQWTENLLRHYTAYKRQSIRSELLATTDFQSFRMTPLGGSSSRNKGMALFSTQDRWPLCDDRRQDNENLYLIYSDDLYSWEGGQPILQPQYPWDSSRSAIAVHPSSWMTAGCC